MYILISRKQKRTRNTPGGVKPLYKNTLYFHMCKLRVYISIKIRRWKPPPNTIAKMKKKKKSYIYRNNFLKKNKKTNKKHNPLSLLTIGKVSEHERRGKQTHSKVH